MKNRVLVVLTLLFAAMPLSAQRLPRNVLPVAYTIEFAPDLASASFRGRESIEVQVQRPSKTVTLHADEISFQSVRAWAGGARRSAAVALDRTTQRAILTFEEPLPVGPATLEIEFTGTLNRLLRGFYLGEANGRRYAATQLQAIDARRAFPCFDEPDLRATFAISIVADARDTAISNGEIVSDTAGPEGKHTIRFATTPRIPTYLVAMVVGDFACASDTVDGVPLRVCALREKAPMTGYALNAAADIVRYFHSYLSLPYAFSKLDHIAIPDFRFGAMENAGAVIYRETALLADEKTASPAARRSIASIIAHETAHQWFGDVVTMKWWDDIWLSEGFASWMTPKAMASLRPEADAGLADAALTGDPMSLDVLDNTVAVHHPVANPDDDSGTGSIVYGKAAAVLRMTESFAGEERFRSGVNLYLERNAFGSVTSSDFSAAIAEAAGRPAAEVLDSYVRQPGLPLVSVDAACRNGETTLTLRQERFFANRKRLGSSEQRWVIPVCPKGGECVVLREPAQTYRLAGCRTPFVANADARGFFITRPDRDGAAELRRNVGLLTPAERLAFSRDEWLLARVGLRPVGDALDLAAALAGETEGVLVAHVLDEVAFVERHLVTPAQRPAFHTWLRGMLQSSAASLGWAPLPGERDEVRQRRTAVLETLGDAGGDPATRQRALKLARSYVRDARAVDPSMASTVLRLAAAGGDARFHDEVRTAYLAARDPERSTRLLNALTQFGDPALLQRTLDLSLTGAVRSQDAGRVISSVLRSPHGSEIGMKFLEARWDAIAAKLSPRVAAGLVTALGASCRPSDAEFIDAFVERHGAHGAERAVAQAKERIANCADFRSVQTANLAEWMAGRR